jgi:hypothetical protein
LTETHLGMSKTPKHDPQWAKAKTLCRLNVEDVRMAKELGMTPKTLLRNRPSPNQKWKMPVKFWIQELHEKRFGRKRKTVIRPPVAEAAADEPQNTDVPF